MCHHQAKRRHHLLQHARPHNDQTHLHHQKSASASVVTKYKPTSLCGKQQTEIPNSNSNWSGVAGDIFVMSMLMLMLMLKSMIMLMLMFMIIHNAKRNTQRMARALPIGLGLCCWCWRFSGCCCSCWTWELGRPPYMPKTRTGHCLLTSTTSLTSGVFVSPLVPAHKAPH